MLFSFIFLSFLLFVFVAVMVFLVITLVSQIISGRRGAPYVPIGRKLVWRLLDWGGVTAGDTVYDLGCGDARVLISAVRDFGAKRGIGYEIAPWPYLKAGFMVRVAGLDNKIKIFRKDFFKTDLRDADFVYIYLFPKLVDELATKMAGELPAGAKVLCPSFPIDLVHHPEFKLLKTQKFDKITAYLYQRI